MGAEVPEQSHLASSTGTGRFLPLLLILFIGSGCSALIYEIVWFQMLRLVIGSSAVSLGILLGTFMGGMCLGSLIFPRLISARRHPLRVYAVLEIGIGITGVGLFFGMPYVSELYSENIGYGMPGFLLRGGVCALCLLVPTMLMGATLPAIARWMETTPKGVSRLGFFYGANIAGAVFGCLLAGFYLLRVYDNATATFVAAALNVTVALISLGLAFWCSYQPTVASHAEERVRRAPGAWLVYVTIAMSGMCALGAEVIWTRQLSLLLGASVYTFSIILTVFLIGLGIGSTIGAYLARELIRPRIALGLCQLFLTAAIAWTAYMLAESLPYWPIDARLASTPWLMFQLDLMRCIWTVLPATILWGASFPLALASVAERGQDPGRLVGGVYAANTVGAIAGAIGFSMVLIGSVGTQATQRIVIGLSAAAALLMFVPLFWEKYTLVPKLELGNEGKGRNVPRALASAVVLTALTALAIPMAWSVPETPAALIAYGRHLPVREGEIKYIYTGEGMNASIAVSELPGRIRNFHVSGKVVASNEPHDMRLQLMLGHISALMHPRPRSVLIVGCGAGVTAGTFVLHPSIEKIVICEIEPLIPPAAAKYFAKENNDVVKDPRVTIVYDDARHYIATTKEKFDIITSDPIHPWVKGAAALYSKEYFELCKQHLNPDGVISQWVPLYESNMEAVKSEFATFFDVFPEGTVWSNDVGGEGYDVILLGHAGSTTIDVDKLQERLERDDHWFVVQSLKAVELSTPLQLLMTYAGRYADMKPWLADAEINRDRNLRLQYLAGMGLNTYEENDIYQSFVVYRKYPEDLFVGSENSRNLLKRMFTPSKTKR